MNLPQKAILVITMSLFSSCGTKQTPPDPSVLVTAEHNFAAMAVEKGTRAAFLQFAADDAVMFVPGPVLVKEHYETAKDSPGRLSWQPIYAEISSGGDLGWTTGPWEWRSQMASDTPQYFGHYNTIWRLQPDSTWKFVVDFGVAHGPYQAATTPPTLRVLDCPEQVTNLPATVAREELLQLEYTFAAASAAEGLIAAYLPRMADDIRICRVGMVPLQGTDAALALLGSVDGVTTWEPLHVEVARNGDLGYVFGSGTVTVDTNAVKVSFMHIWRKDGNGVWKLALDVQSPLVSE
jgi:ketosteroid isomerase-like protein